MPHNQLEFMKILGKYFKNNEDAKTVVSDIEQVIDNKFDSKKGIFLTKEDKVDLIKAIYFVGFIQFLAIVGSVLAIIKFMK